jgi:hypothetical protein
MPLARASLCYFGLVFGAGFVLGALRVTLLVPRLGIRAAELLEMPVMFVVILWSARFVLRHFGLGASASRALGAGLLALALLVAAELTLAFVVSGLTPGQYITTRDPVSGSVYLALLMVFALAPWWLARGR